MRKLNVKHEATDHGVLVIEHAGLANPRPFDAGFFLFPLNRLTLPGVEAITELVERWQDRLWRLALSLTDDEQAAWDVLQEARMVISRRIGRLGDPAAFPAWAYRIRVGVIR